MKRFLIIFCCVFTVITLFCSFSVSKQSDRHFLNAVTSNYSVDKIDCDGKKYIVVTSSEGVAICKE